MHVYEVWEENGALEAKPTKEKKSAAGRWFQRQNLLWDDVQELKRRQSWETWISDLSKKALLYM